MLNAGDPLALLFIEILLCNDKTGICFDEVFVHANLMLRHPSATMIPETPVHAYASRFHSTMKMSFLARGVKS